MAGYAVGRRWQTDLEPGDWYEIVYDDEKRLIAGFVFVPRRGKAQYREADGKIIPDARADTAWAGAVERYDGEEARP